jgi:hypothetical protein
MSASQDREDRAFEVLDVATKPAQFAIGMVKMLFLIIILLVVAMGYPTYTYFTGGTVTPFQLECAITAFLFIFTFIVAPWYTVLGGILVFVGYLCLICVPAIGYFNPFPLIVGFFAIGIMQWAIRRAQRKSAEHERSVREAESRRTQDDEERKRRRAENRERAKFRNENKEIFAGISELLSSCEAPATEMLRAVKAIEGGDIVEDPRRILISDIARILVAFRDAGGSDHSYLEMLWSELIGRISPPTGDEIQRPLFFIKNEGVKRLGMVSLLANYDRQQGTSLSSNAASTYLSIISAVSNHCEGSLAAKIVADAYVELLRPYIHKSGRDGYAGRSTSSTGSQSSRKSDCEECNKAFMLLDLSYGASDEAVKSKKRAFAELLHDDRLGAMSDNARRIAQEQHKSVNEACDHILRDCKVRARTDD